MKVKNLAQTTKKPSHPEYQLQVQISNYLNLQISMGSDLTFYNSEKGSAKMTIPQQARYRPLLPIDNFKQPDLMIVKKGQAEALYLELKAKSPFRKDGKTLLANEHIEAQAKSLEYLRTCGHTAEFCWSFDDARFIIDSFM
jgi:hypothetical protein